MDTKTRLMTLTAAAVLAGSTAFAQTVDPGPSTPSTFDFGFLGDLFGGAERPSGGAIADALAGAGLTVDRVRTRGDDVRIEAVTEDGQRVRIRVEDGEVRYRVRSASSSSSSDTSDSNDDSNGSSTGSSDANGPTSGGGNGGRSGGGNGGGSGGGNGGGSGGND
jgi:hypothetical protein